MVDYERVDVDGQVFTRKRASGAAIGNIQFIVRLGRVVSFRLNFGILLAFALRALDCSRCQVFRFFKKMWVHRQLNDNDLTTLPSKLFDQMGHLTNL